MAAQTDPSAEPRIRLTRERVLLAAIDLADKGGIGALSMRKLGQELGVEAMSLYNHVANTDDILDGIVDLVFSEIGLPPRGASLRAVKVPPAWAKANAGVRSSQAYQAGVPTAMATAP